MEKEYFDSLIENISGQLRDFLEIRDKNNNEFNKGVVAGMYYVSDSIKNMLTVQNDVNNTNSYKEFIKLVNDIERKLQ